MVHNGIPIEVEPLTSQGYTDSIEELQAILMREQLEPMSYDEVRALGYELVTFFVAFDAPGTQMEADNGSPDIA